MKNSQIFLSFILVIVLLISYNASSQEQKTISGIVVEKYETKDGTITIQYPEKIISGKTISGKVFVEPKSTKPSKRASQLNNLLNHTLVFGKAIPIKNGIFVTQLPKKETIPFKVVNPKGGSIGETIIKMSKSLGKQELKMPQTIKANNIERIVGDFSGDITSAKLTLDNNPVELIAGNNIELFYEVQDVEPGKHSLSLDYGKNKKQQEINLIDYTLSLGQSTLKKGEKTNLNVIITGLHDLVDSLKFEIINESLGTISLEGGRKQILVIYPYEISTTGIWEKNFAIRSIKGGTFKINTDLTILDESELSETDSINDIFIDEFEPLEETTNQEEAEDKKNNNNVGTENLDPEFLNNANRNRTNPLEISPQLPTKKQCVKFPLDPNIDDRLGWDLIGGLFADGIIESDYLNDFRAGTIKQQLNGAKTLSSSLQTILNENYFKAHQCSNSLAHADVTQEFPDFPWEDIFLTVDLCDVSIDSKTRLKDFLDPNCDFEALNKWRNDFESAVQNFGIPQSASGYSNMLSSFSNNTSQAMAEIDKAYKTFQEDMRVTLALRYNASKARSRMWEAVAFTMGTALSVVTGGGSVALAAVFVSTSGFILEQGMTTMGMDENIAQLVTAIATAGIGASDLIMATSTTVVTEGLNTMSQNNVESYAMSMALLDDDVWAKMIENLSEDYRAGAINQFNAHRNILVGAVKEQLAKLCRIKNSMEKLLPETEKAVKDAEVWVSSSFWRKMWNESMNNTLDCCCEYSDGSGPHSSCKQTIPPFGFDPHEFLLMLEQRDR